MTNVYKIKLFRWNFEGNDTYLSHCIENDYIGWGWKNKKNPEIKQSVKNLYEYYRTENAINEGIFGGSPKKLKESLKVANTMQKGDLCWTYGGKKGEKWSWHLGLITEDEFQCGNCDYNWSEMGMLRKCEWHKVPFDLVPGNITAFTHDRSTLRLIATDEKKSEKDEKNLEIDNSSYVTYCRFLYEYYKHLDDIPTNLGLNFWQLAHPDDLEDLVGLYLQKEENYYIFPSTNKQGTRDYEFKLISHNGKKNAIIQCKNNADIPWKTLDEYDNEVIFVLSVKESDNRTTETQNKCPENWDMGWQSKDGRIKIFDAEKLKKWANKKENREIMPNRIQKYLKFSESEE